MEHKITKLGKINPEFDVFKLKSALTKNDAGDWGYEPIEGNANGILRSTNFTNQGILDLSDVAYRTLKPQKLAEKKLSAGEIIIERSGGSDSQPVGRIGFITPEIADNNYAFANFIQRIAVDETIEPKYLYYCLQQMYEMGITASMQYQTTGIRNLDWKLYTKSILPKPKPEEQKAIATILSKVDEAIKATENSIKAAEKLKKSLMQNLLTGKLKPDGTWRKEDEFYMDEKFGNVPVGWEVKRVEQLVNRRTDNFDPLKSSESLDYVGLEHILPNEFRREGVGKSDETLALKIKFFIGDVLLGKLRPYLNKVWIADLNGVGSTEFLVFEGNKYSKWVYLNFQSKRFLDFTQSVTAGTQHPRASYRDVKRFLLSVPKDDNEMDLITNAIISTEKLKDDKLVRIKMLQRLKKSLMQNLLTGKVRVDLSKIENVITDEAV